MENGHLIIDGSQGEGGGQIVRSTLSLSMVTGRAVIENIRAGRKKPGLLRQHLTALRAAAEICDAQVEGDELRSSRLVFEPGPVRGGSYSFHIGTAGSTTLVLQTILPALMVADSPSTVFIEGGTHNPMAPPFDFLEKSYVPLLARMGPSSTARSRRARRLVHSVCWRAGRSRTAIRERSSPVYLNTSASVNAALSRAS